MFVCVVCTHYYFMAKSIDRFTDNFSILLSSGMSVPEALSAVADDMPSVHFKQQVLLAREKIELGEPVWKTVRDFKLLPAYTISLVRLGEESGRLMESVAAAAEQRQKDKLFSSQLRSAMMYPVLVLSLTVTIGIGMSWFVLPRLATVFNGMNIELPAVTKVLIAFGTFMQNHGLVVVPVATVVMVAGVYFLFFLKKTKFIGQTIILHTPGVGTLLKDTEMARFTSMFGLLLGAGLPILLALDSLAEATDFAVYRKFYKYLGERVEQGETFRTAFANYKNAASVMPISVQKIMISGEESGKLRESLLKIGSILESRTGNMTKDVASILEPILLIIVWLGVCAVAFAIILPIYSLVGNFNTR